MTKQFSLKELAKLTQTKLIGNPKTYITNVNTLLTASEQDASFLANPRYTEVMKNSKAGVICIDHKTHPIEGKNFLVSDDPSRTFQMIAEIVLASHSKDCDFIGIHPTASIHDSVKIGENVGIGPYVVIENGAKIGDRTKIYAHSYIGVKTSVGNDCIIHPGAIIRERCTLENRVILQPGAIIGSCGFGYTTNAKTGKHTKLEQLGTVILEDDVEIGANTTIDRARFKTTLIKKGTKIDNLVQIAHNVELGENNIIVSQSGIAGSTTLGNNVYLGGQTGILGHVTIADNVQIASRGGVSKSILKAGKYRGSPVTSLTQYNKREVYLRNIEKFIQEIKELKQRIAKLEEKTSAVKK